MNVTNTDTRSSSMGTPGGVQTANRILAGFPNANQTQSNPINSSLGAAVSATRRIIMGIIPRCRTQDTKILRSPSHCTFHSDEDQKEPQSPSNIIQLIALIAKATRVQSNNSRICIRVQSKDQEPNPSRVLPTHTAQSQ